MIIASPRKKVSINVTACDIQQRSDIKYLGVFIDDTLKWDTHIQHVNNRLAKNLGVVGFGHWSV